MDVDPPGLCLDPPVPVNTGSPSASSSGCVRLRLFFQFFGVGGLAGRRSSMEPGVVNLRLLAAIRAASVADRMLVSSTAPSSRAAYSYSTAASCASGIDVFLALSPCFVHVLGIDFRDFDKKNEEIQVFVCVRKYRNMLLVGRRFLAASRCVYNMCVFLYILEVISWILMKQRWSETSTWFVRHD